MTTDAVLSRELKELHEEVSTSRRERSLAAADHAAASAGKAVRASQPEDTLGQEVRDAKDAIAGFVHNPLDAATHKLLVPAAISIIRGLRAKKDQP